MEGEGVRALVMFFVVIGMVAGQTYAASPNFKWGCFPRCFFQCNFPIPHFDGCALECIAKCITPSGSDLHHYCNLGCASSRCTSISTLQNPGEEAVEGCVGSCKDICSKHH